MTELCRAAAAAAAAGGIIMVIARWRRIELARLVITVEFVILTLTTVLMYLFTMVHKVSHVLES